MNSMCIYGRKKVFKGRDYWIFYSSDIDFRDSDVAKTDSR